MILHTETISKAGATNSSSPAAPGNSRLMESAAHMAANTEASHFESEQGTLYQRATDAVSEGLQAGAENVLNGVLACYGTQLNEQCTLVPVCCSML